MKKAFLYTAGAGALASIVSGMSYYSGLYKLQFIGITNVNYTGTVLSVKIAIHNPSNWSYPVPVLYFDVFNSQGNYFGYIENKAMQWIKPGDSLIDATLVPQLQSMLDTVAGMLLNDNSEALMFDGNINIANINLPYQFTTQLT